VIGRVFDDRYEVIRQLGSGGMAEVYLANDRLLGRQVALKVLSSRYANDEQFVERFRREASSAASLNHSNIVQIYDRGEAEGTYYIAMEYLEGRSLKEIILRYAPLSPDLVVSIATQILEALRFAHRRDIIHRDIKPQNIIVENDGRVNVTDFGIARAGNVSTMTEAGSILGTAHYLSPEQAQGQPVEAASDLYALGVVMYEMVTGKMPFDGDNPVSIAMKHVHEQPVPPRNLNPDVPENLEAVILRALGKHPIERYLTAQAMLDDLQRVQEGLPVAAPAAFNEEATQVMSPAAAAAAASAASATQATQIRRRVPDDAELPPAPYYDEPPRRQSVWPWILVIVLILALGGAAYAILSNWGSAEAELLPVPGVLGLTVQDAQQKLKDAGFEMKNEGDQASADVPEGQVARQDPDEGTRLAKGETVSVWISSGVGLVEVPDVVGKNQVEAAQILGALDFVVDPQEEVSTDQEPGTVLRQNPEAGQEVEVGTTVTIVVAIAGDTVTVPLLIGSTRDQAEALLEGMNLVPRVEPVDSTLPGGQVVDQSPPEGEEVQPGSTVTIYVSNAPEETTVRVPAVAGRGLTVSEAIDTLEQYDLRARVTQYETPDFPPGTIIQQDPPAGREVERGSSVELLVAKEPSTTTTSSTTTTTTPTTLPPSTETTAPPTTPTTAGPDVTEF
jgi:beta-lactam-binding protein with PASTA domain/tRNA A-37 threonylcarbamoyl transferase component Bud32